MTAHVDRAGLLAHLRNVYTRGMVPEAAFSGPFGTAAVSEDQTFLVETPGLEVLEDLPEEVGVLDLELLIDALSTTEREKVGIGFEGQRLVIRAGTLTFELVTTAPHAIHTRLEAEQMATIRNQIPEDADAFTLQADTMSELLSVQGVLNADAVSFTTGPEESAFTVGRGTENLATVEVPFAAGRTYTIRLSARAVTRLFQTLGGSAEVRLTGPDSLVAVDSGPYRYYLSPLAEEA